VAVKDDDDDGMGYASCMLAVVMTALLLNSRTPKISKMRQLNFSH